MRFLLSAVFVFVAMGLQAQQIYKILPDYKENTGYRMLNNSKMEIKVLGKNVEGSEENLNEVVNLTTDFDIVMNMLSAEEDGRIPIDYKINKVDISGISPEGDMGDKPNLDSLLKEQIGQDIVYNPATRGMELKSVEGVGTELYQFMEFIQVNNVMPAGEIEVGDTLFVKQDIPLPLPLPMPFSMETVYILDYVDGNNAHFSVDFITKTIDIDTSENAEEGSMDAFMAEFLKNMKIDIQGQGNAVYDLSDNIFTDMKSMATMTMSMEIPMKGNAEINMLMDSDVKMSIE